MSPILGFFPQRTCDLRRLVYFLSGRALQDTCVRPYTSMSSFNVKINESFIRRSSPLARCSTVFTERQASWLWKLRANEENQWIKEYDIIIAILMDNTWDWVVWDWARVICQWLLCPVPTLYALWIEERMRGGEENEQIVNQLVRNPGVAGSKSFYPVWWRFLRFVLGGKDIICALLLKYFKLESVEKNLPIQCSTP